MSASLIIRKILAASLMLVFTLGITPSRALHNIVAAHTDAEYVKHDHPGACISNAVFNCQCDHFVTESPFVATSIVPELETPQYFFGYAEQQINGFHSAKPFAYSLRGPPAC